MKIKKIASTILLGLMAIAQEVFAAAIENPLGTTDIGKILGQIVKYFLGFLSVIMIAMFVYGGFLWMTSGGSAEKVKKGRDTLTWAVIGAFIIVLSYSLVRFVLKAFPK